MYWFLIVATLMTTPALAHDFWGNGQEVDPVTKQLCCGKGDAHVLDERTAIARGNGYYLKDTGETIPYGRVQPSPDGLIWAFRWGGETKCFFAPVGSF